MSKSGQNDFLNPPNQQEWITKKRDENLGDYYSVDYNTLLNNHNGDKSSALNELKSTPNLAADFDTIEFNFKGDKNATFDFFSNKKFDFVNLENADEKTKENYYLNKEKYQKQLEILGDTNADITKRREGLAIYKANLDIYGLQNQNENYEFKSQTPQISQKETSDLNLGINSLDFLNTNPPNFELDTSLKRRNKDFDLPYKDVKDEEYNPEAMAKVLGLEKSSFLKDKLPALIGGYFEIPELIVKQNKPENYTQAMIDENIRAKILQGGNVNDLDLQESQRLLWKYRQNSGVLRDLVNVGAIANNPSDVKAMIAEQFEKEKREAKISKAENINELSQEDWDYIYEKEGVLNRSYNKIFKDKTDTIKEGFAKIKAGAAGEIISQKIESAKNFHKSYNIAWLVKNYATGSDEAKKAELNDIMGVYDTIAKMMQFDGIATNEKTGDLFFYKKNDNDEPLFLKVNEGFFDNFGTILRENAFAALGGVAGAIYGAKKLANPKKINTKDLNNALKGGEKEVKKLLNSLSFKGSMIGGALGGMAGSTADYINYCLREGQSPDLETMIYHGVQDGLFSVAFDAGIWGGAKIINKIKDTNLGEFSKNLAENIKRPFNYLGEKALDISVVGRMAKNILDGNAPEIRRAIKENMSFEQREALRNSDLGLEVNFQPKSNPQTRQKIVDRFGENSFIVKGYDLFNRAFKLGGQENLQRELLATMRGDEEQNLLGYLVEVAMNNPQHRSNLHKMLNDTSATLITELKQFGFKNNEIENILNHYKVGTKQDFSEAMESVLMKIYGDKKLYNTTLGNARWNSFKKEMLQNNAAFGVEVITPFIEQVEKLLYNPKGVGFKDLRSLHEWLNEGFKKLRKKSSKSEYLKQQVDGFIREDLNRAYNQIFEQNEIVAKDMRELFDVAMLDYANMSQITKEMGDGLTAIKNKNNVRTTAQDYERAVENLLGMLMRDVPQGQEPFFTKITRILPKDEAERFEITILDKLLDKSRLLITSGDKKVLDIVNSGEFLRQISKIQGNFSKKGQEYINLVRKFHDKFKNDAQIAISTKNPAHEAKVSTGLNPELSSRLKFIVSKSIFDMLFRIMPRIPIITQPFDKKIHAASLRFYINRILNESMSVGALRRKIEFDLNSGYLDNKINSATRAKLREILDDGIKPSELDFIQAQKQAQNETSIFTQAQKQNAQMATNPLERMDEFSLYDLLNDPKAKAELNVNEKQILDEIAKREGKTPSSDLSDLPNTPPRNDEAVNLAQNTAENTAKQSEISSENTQEITPPSKVEDIIPPKKKFTPKDPREQQIQAQAEARAAENPRENTQNLAQNTAENTAKQSEISSENTQEITPPSKVEDITPPENKQGILAQAEQENAQKLEQSRLESELLLAEERQKRAQLEAKFKAKEARAGKGVLDDNDFVMGDEIPYKKIDEGYLNLSKDDSYELDYVIVKRDDLKPNLTRGGLQFRDEDLAKQTGTINEIAQGDFKPQIVMTKSSDFNGLPIITKDGQILAGNNRMSGILAQNAQNRAKYTAQAKKEFGVDLGEDEFIVRRIKTDDEPTLLRLAAASNFKGGNSFGEDVLATLGHFGDKIKEFIEKVLPGVKYHIPDEDLGQTTGFIARGLNERASTGYDENLAFLAKITRNTANRDIAWALNSIAKNTTDQNDAKSIREMYVYNAGTFWNLAYGNPNGVQIDLTPFLVDAIDLTSQVYRAKNLNEIFKGTAEKVEQIIAISKSTPQQIRDYMSVYTNYFNNLKAEMLGGGLARFAKLENPSGQLFEFMKSLPETLEKRYSGNLEGFSDFQNKAVSEIDDYDLLIEIIATSKSGGGESGRKIISKMNELREAENKIKQVLDENAKREGKTPQSDLSDLPNTPLRNDEAENLGENTAENTAKQSENLGENLAKQSDNLDDVKFASQKVNNDYQATFENFFKPERPHAPNEIKEYNKAYNLEDANAANEINRFYKANAVKNDETNAIFDKVFDIAQQLGVKIKFAPTQQNRSSYNLAKNEIVIEARLKGNLAAQDLLHELIHATTRKALKMKENNDKNFSKFFNRRQEIALEEIKDIYTIMKGRWLGLTPEQQAAKKAEFNDEYLDYGFQNIDEFVSELSNDNFRRYLRTENIWERIKKFLYEFVFGGNHTWKTPTTDAEKKVWREVNAADALKESYFRFLDAYEIPSKKPLNEVAIEPSLFEPSLFGREIKGLQKEKYSEISSENPQLKSELAKKYELDHLNNLEDGGVDLAKLNDFANNGNKTAKTILENYETNTGGRGYVGHSMSVNAYEAQENGVKPLSKFTAKDAAEVSELFGEQISTNELKQLLRKFGNSGEWHHTSKFYNKTPHYSVARLFTRFNEAREFLSEFKGQSDLRSINQKVYEYISKRIDKAAEYLEKHAKYEKLTRQDDGYSESKQELLKEVKATKKKIKAMQKQADNLSHNMIEENYYGNDRNLSGAFYFLSENDPKFVKFMGEFDYGNISYAPQRSLFGDEIPQNAEKIKKAQAQSDASFSLISEDEFIRARKNFNPNALTKDDKIAQEKLALKGVFYGGKSPAKIYKDIEAIDEWITLYKGNEKSGAKHIKIKHLGEFSEGYLNENEVLNLGVYIRDYIAKFGDPYETKDGTKRIYEWFNEGGDKFRVIVRVKNSRLGRLREQSHALNPAQTSESIITYFSNRFSKKGINFLNPRVKSAYENEISPYLRDLAAWHKDSSPYTKNADGTPKIFYHGSGQTFEVFDMDLGNNEIGRNAMYFSTSKKVADTYKIWDENSVYEVFLKIKNPFIIDFKGRNYNDRESFIIINTLKEMGVAKKHDSVIFKNIRDEYTDGRGRLADTILIFNPNQIKAVNNRGLNGRYFDENNPNIYYANNLIGTGLFGGVLNGVESDENGNISFNPTKFLQGFAMGAGGTLAVRKSLQVFGKKQAKIYPNIAKDNPNLMQKIAQKSLLFKGETAGYNALTQFINKSKILKQIDEGLNPQIIGGQKALLSGHYEPQKARLKKAQDLQKNGADELEIWEKTGWYFDKDGKWKFEINARGGKIDTIKDDGIKYVNLSNETRLGFLLDDKALFKAYPELANLKVVKSDSGTWYDMDERVIYLDTNFGVKETKETLYHEIQHAVQVMENFALGGNESFALNLAKKQGQFQSVVNDLKAQNRLELIGDENKKRLAYERLGGEVEARNVEKRLLNKNAQKQPPFLTQDTPRDKMVMWFGDSSLKNDAKISAGNFNKGEKMNADGNYLYKDDNGKNHFIQKEIGDAWIRTFNLKNLSDDFVPNFSNEVQNALKNAGISSKMHLKIGSLKKLINRGRVEFLPYIKDTIENADKILKDDKKGILFTKEFIIKKTQNKQERIFVSVAKDYNGEWIFTSHSFRDKNNIQNKLKNGVVIYKKIA